MISKTLKLIKNPKNITNQIPDLISILNNIGKSILIRYIGTQAINAINVGIKNDLNTLNDCSLSILWLK